MDQDNNNGQKVQVNIPVANNAPDNVEDGEMLIVLR